MSSCSLTFESLELVLMSENLSSLEYLIFAKNEVRKIPNIATKTGAIKNLLFLDLRENPIRERSQKSTKAY